jgi:hypothetical protein
LEFNSRGFSGDSLVDDFRNGFQRIASNHRAICAAAGHA